MERTPKTKKIAKIIVETLGVGLILLSFILKRVADPERIPAFIEHWEIPLVILLLAYSFFLMWFDQFFKKAPKERNYTPVIGIAMCIIIICFMIIF